jgi:hypothetical protein
VGEIFDNDNEKSRNERDGRIPFQAKVLLTDRKTGEQMEGEAFDLSMGGMFIRTLLPPTPGTLLEVEVPMEPLNYRGLARVMKELDVDEAGDRPFGMAVGWVDQTLNQKRLLSIRINDHIRGGGLLLEGNPYNADEPPRVAKTTAAPAPAAAIGRNRLVIGLAIVAAAVLVVVVGVILLL